MSRITLLNRDFSTFFYLSTFACGYVDNFFNMCIWKLLIVLIN